MKKKTINNTSRKITLLFLYSIVLSFFIFISVDIAEARAGGGGGRSGGSHSHSHSHRSSSHRSRPMTPAEREAAERRMQENFNTIKKLLPFHLICLCILFYRGTLKNNNKQDTDFGGYVMLSFFFCLFTCFYPIACIIDFAILGFAINSLVKFKRLVPFGYEDELAKEQKNKNIISLLKKSNPNFNFDIFKNRIKKAFTIIQNAWSMQNIKRARLLLGGGTFQQFQIQTNIMINKKIVDVMKELKISEINIEKYESNSCYESVYISVCASAINYRMNKSNNTTIEGSRTSKDYFTEIWCFSKNKNAKNILQNGIIEGCCPNCLTRISDTNNNKCSSCGLSLVSGQNDWILTGIFQKSSWKDNHNKNIPGLRNLLNYDPNFNIQNIEDKLSMMFWSIIQFKEDSDDTLIFKVSSEDFVNKYVKYSSLFNNYDRAGIDYIEIVGIYKNINNNNHYLLANIVWNGRIPGYSTSYNNTLFVLKRNVEALTDTNKYFSEICCPYCGANVNDGDTLICEHCNNPINDYSKDWILSNVYDYYNDFTIICKLKKYCEDYEQDYSITKHFKNKESVKNPLYKEQNSNNATIEVTNQYNQTQNYLSVNWNELSNFSQKDLLRITIAVMLADGIIDPRELNIIRAICKRYSIPEKEINNTINELKNISNPLDYILNNIDLKYDKNLLLVLIRIAATDGRIADEEILMLERVSEKMGITKRELMDMINRVYEQIWNRKSNNFRMI